MEEELFEEATEEQLQILIGWFSDQTYVQKGEKGPTVQDLFVEFQRLKDQRGPFRVYSAVLKSLERLGFNGTNEAVKRALYVATFKRDKREVVKVIRTWFVNNSDHLISILESSIDDEEFWRDLYYRARDKAKSLIQILKEMREDAHKRDLIDRLAIEFDD